MGSRANTLDVEGMERMRNIVIIRARTRGSNCGIEVSYDRGIAHWDVACRFRTSRLVARKGCVLLYFL
jgi:hypothetical protein